MKTNVCGATNGLKLSGLLSVLYTDTGEQTSVKGCDAKVAIIDGLGSRGLLEVLVVADKDDFEKPRKKFDLVHDSVRLLVLPPKDLDGCLGDASEFMFEDECRQKKKSSKKSSKKSRSELDERVALIETQAADFHRAVDSLATSIWHGLVSPKNRLDRPVADRIYEDIVPRTMAPARPLEGTRRPFIKKWRPVTEEDYDLLWKDHFSLGEQTSEPEYDDLNKIVFRAASPEKAGTRSLSAVLCQRGLEYMVIGAIAVALRWAFCTDSECTNVQRYWKGSAAGNGSAVANGTAPVADGLVQALDSSGNLGIVISNFRDAAKEIAAVANISQTGTGAQYVELPQFSFDMAKSALVEAAKTICERLTPAWDPEAMATRGDPTVVPQTGFGCGPRSRPQASFAWLNRPGAYVDSGTGWDLQWYRSPLTKCVQMEFNPERSDLWVGPLTPDSWVNNWAVCGWPGNATLMCRDLGVSNPQCFEFASWNEGPLGLRFLIGMINRIFHPTGDEDCILRCQPSDKEDVRASRLAEAQRRVSDREFEASRPVLDGDGCSSERLQRFVEAVKENDAAKYAEVYSSKSLPFHHDELSPFWFKAPCGSGMWVPGEPRPTCTCPKLRITCEMSRKPDQTFELLNSNRTTSQDAFTAISSWVLPEMRPERCFYQCLTPVFSNSTAE
ncbi:hypothetical protein GNI_119820 [Gregarina niphandrodes]|uniref:Uncharacterized protein n=1 Tax=Gregarina niphandrodes TaxID=110365 RepID=A0A023B2I1_GRENI|nr:hypothetical protein GNI_119820 [Gregarina niphandrodes]EZG54812.1 hypothetical protein GNI_119820 [Gregarina niphandrodes]|eukprot:XP_011131826.1 hypothetical protein GNI_119820 [Gregarina niphandrodes]